MWLILSLMVIGGLIGFFFRNLKQIRYTGHFITWFIYLLLFFLGISIGHNKNIINNLSSIGLYSLILALASMIGSILLGWLLYKKLFVKNDKSTEVTNSSNSQQL